MGSFSGDVALTTGCSSCFSDSLSSDSSTTFLFDVGECYWIFSLTYSWASTISCSSLALWVGFCAGSPFGVLTFGERLLIIFGWELKAWTVFLVSPAADGYLSTLFGSYLVSCLGFLIGTGLNVFWVDWTGLFFLTGRISGFGYSIGLVETLRGEDLFLLGFMDGLKVIASLLFSYSISSFVLPSNFLDSRFLLNSLSKAGSPLPVSFALFCRFCFLTLPALGVKWHSSIPFSVFVLVSSTLFSSIWTLVAYNLAWIELSIFLGTCSLASPSLPFSSTFSSSTSGTGSILSLIVTCDFLRFLSASLLVLSEIYGLLVAAIS